ncbi:e3 ubiquitin-protein ligase SHPRH [Nephila pilipes]|uniref:E3 ubiquitin-protein ligase SHPRH n=1 Tax=Nephila pilipes TaxID=299642 RepID=A0A8X6UQS8_NEPPI|nr:e3 ubiquitin-protein ligase SHPRH [Nephila pilipes]
MGRRKSSSQGVNPAFRNLNCPEVVKPYLDNFESFLKLHVSLENQKYKIGSFSMCLYSTFNCENVETVYLHFKEKASTFFLWGKSKKDEKQVKISYANCELPPDVMKSLSTPKLFDLVLDVATLQCANLLVYIFINSSIIKSLNHPSEPYLSRYRTEVQTVVKYFHGISTKDYKKDYIDEEGHIEKIYECIKNSFNSNEKVVEISHSCLIPKLREYQSQAVHWMTKCEARSSYSENNIKDHILYSELHLADESKIYYHKYGGFFVTQKFNCQPLSRGGILADEMGLGKTVEVLACILLNPRKEYNKLKEKVSTYEKCNLAIKGLENAESVTFLKRKINDSEDVVEENSRKRKVNVEENQFKCKKCGVMQERDHRIHYDLSICPMCLEDSYKLFGEELSDFDSNNSAGFCGEDKFMEPGCLSSDSDEGDSFECVCGSAFGGQRWKIIIQCKKCGLKQHPDCVLAEPETSFVDYMCPYCCVEPSMVPVSSRATLIVSPSAILYQWVQEIDRHVRKNTLKIFLYNGVEHHKFINPKILADYDIVLSSYETLRKELSHINVPHGTNQRPLRRPKKFRTLPSPLSSIEWWRICLDEAQMVEGVTTKSAQMALQLKCINRWCVTGTPIQKSVEDLFGLLLFLGYDPYHEKVWWKELLWKSFACGETEKLAFVLNDIMWRTPKNHVLNQIGIPDQKIVVHEMWLSQIEKVFYEHLRSKCRNDFMENIRKYDCEDLHLRNMDKHVLSKIILPMKKLQKACCHFQLTGDNFTDIQKNKMTIPQLLDHLLKKASYDCEEVHRNLLLNLNGLAGIFTIKEEYKNACEMYKKALISVEENKATIRTDVLQQIHALHNFVELVSMWMSNRSETNEIKETLKCDNISVFMNDLKKKSTELSETYLQKYKLITQNCKESLDQNNKEINNITSQLELRTNSFPSRWWMYVLRSMDEEMRKFFVMRIKESLMDAPGRSFLPNSISISDRFHDSTGLSYCLVTLSDELHKSRFLLIDAVSKITMTPTADVLNKAIECHLRPTPGHKVPRCLYCKANDIFCQYESKLFRFNESPVSNEDSSDSETICLPQLRKGSHADSEFELILKVFVNFIRHRKDLSFSYECGINELKLFDAMKKEFKQLRHTWLKASEYISAIDELEMAKMSLRLLLPGEEPPDPSVPYIILPHALQSTRMQFQSDVICHQNELKKKLGQLFYLQNLKKAQNAERPFEESCPVCCQKLENSWSVLQCGHNFCLSCIHILTRPSASVLHTIRCPVCREVTSSSDIYFIDTPQVQLEDIDIKGSYSAKVSSVVKCLLKIRKKDCSAKSLVFSTWTDLLCLLEHALMENEIPFVNLNKRKNFQSILDLFKQSSTVNVLLLPLNVGANGLNIIEATNVLLVEPVLDNSKVLQAIGRVHRMGQTRETVIHKFVIKDTIEQNIYEIHKSDLSENLGSSLTVHDLKRLFDEE